MSVRFSKIARRRLKAVTKADGNGDTPHNYVIRAVLEKLERDEARIRRRVQRAAPNLKKRR